MSATDPRVLLLAEDASVVLALDCAYHFAPSRRSFFESVRAHPNRPRLGVTDVVLKKGKRDMGYMEWFLVRCGCKMSGVPVQNLRTKEEYTNDLENAGFTNIEISVLNDGDVFGGFAAFLKLCDFGSAKALVKGEPNVSYICSRYYRAPELIFGSTDYTTAIDVWSQGCVGAELLLGQPLFPGDSGVDQLVEIIKVLGTPTREEVREGERASGRAREVGVSFCGESGRLTHSFFDELRDPSCRLPNGRELPPLHDFTEHERETYADLMGTLLPEHAKEAAGGEKPAAR
ncbi:hypothetical protein TeGR_g2962, partial [Tetraparma gracilis]